MGTLCRLILLNFEPKSTKVTITNHTIQIQAPFYGQWIVRRVTGDGVTNIFVLFQVFQRVIEWYIIPLHHKKFGKKSQYEKKKDSIYKINTLSKSDLTKSDLTKSDLTKSDLTSSGLFEKNNTENNTENKKEEIHKQLHLQINEDDVDHFWENMVKLCNYVCNALSKLQYTYEQDNQIAVIALQYYINMLKEALDGRYDIEKLPACIVDSKPDNLLDYDKIKNLWDAKKVKEVCHLFDLSFANDDYVNSPDINISKDLKDTKDTKEIRIIKNKKIESYLNAIDGLLNISDEAFRELIQSSNRG
jgi:hypothetical protein